MCNITKFIFPLTFCFGSTQTYIGSFQDNTKTNVSFHDLLPYASAQSKFKLWALIRPVPEVSLLL